MRDAPRDAVRFEGLGCLPHSRTPGRGRPGSLGAGVRTARLAWRRSADGSARLAPDRGETGLSSGKSRFGIMRGPLIQRWAVVFIAGGLGMLSGCALPQVAVELVYFPAPPAEAHVVHLKSFNGLRELVPARAGFLAALRGASVGPYVGTPAGVAYRGGHLYVCDTRMNVVHDWDLATGRARWLGMQGEGVLSKPVAVAVDEEGTVYVSDTGQGAVIAFTVEGAVRQIRPPGRERYRPTAVAVSAGKLYVTDIAAHQVDVFSTGHGRHLESFGGVGDEPGRMYFPMGVDVDDVGRVFVSDMMNGRVQVFDSSHRPVQSMGRPGDRTGDMGNPRHLAVGPDGTVFVADVSFSRVHLFNDKGQLLMLLGRDVGEPGAMPMPVGVAVAAGVPENIAALVPSDFSARYFLFVTNTTGDKRISLFAVK